jgi:hypothetical protein
MQLKTKGQGQGLFASEDPPKPAAAAPLPYDDLMGTGTF